MLLQLGVDSRFVYDESFEQYLLEETRVFYQVFMVFPGFVFLSPLFSFEPESLFLFF